MLIVGVLGAAMIPEHVRASYFSREERAQGVAALHVVDLVVLIESPEDLLDFARTIRPVAYVLGKEFEEERRQSIEPLLRVLDEVSCAVHFHSGSVQYATTDLLFGPQQELEREKLRSFRTACTRQRIELRGLLGRLRKGRAPRLLVIGDTIVDQYVACDALGMSAEAPVLVVRELETREFVGGAAVVAAHVRALGAECHYVSVVGADAPAALVRADHVRRGIGLGLFEDRSRPTTFKIRYMVESQKLFRVSRLQTHSISRSLDGAILETVERLAPDLDGIVVCDFVYGLITPRVLASLQSIAAEHELPLFGDLQCSSQVGNVSKFTGFDLLCPTEREARIALGNNEEGVEWIAQTLLDRTRGKSLVMKLGAAGFIAYARGSAGTVSQHFPALCANPVDVAGAGDSLLAAMSVSLAAGLSMMEASALGACMAAIAVSRVGNVPVERSEMERYVERLDGMLAELE
jgi:rfaE bifunctional protein kinase chain/domain